MQVDEVMTRGVEFVAPEATVQDAAVALAEHDIGAVLVGANGHAEGILTDRDILIRVVADGKSPASTRVRDVMSSSLFCCAPDTSLAAALEQMRSHQVRRLPVVDAERRVVGIVVRSALLSHLAGTMASERVGR